MEQRDKPTQELKNKWHADPKNWKWGIFYYNPEDKRIFPPKKIKSMGWTVNFANLYSILALLIILIIVLGIVQLLKSILKSL